MQFYDKPNGRNVDVFLDKFHMQHVLDFRRRLHIDPFSIPLTDLLLTKLVNINLADKDVRDIISLVDDHQVGETDGGETINKSYIAELCSKDWGLYKTLTLTMD